MTRWLLVFEDPRAGTLWLGKALPRRWLQEGKVIAVSDAPTRWGRIGYRIESHIASGRIAVQLTLPAKGMDAKTRVRLRAPGSARMRSVTVNGRSWARFDADDEAITLPAATGGHVDIVVHY